LIFVGLEAILESVLAAKLNSFRSLALPGGVFYFDHYAASLDARKASMVDLRHPTRLADI
jgi:hypothetical protein